MTERENKFEASMKKLEAIVDELEKGDFSLEESLQKFEEGLKLGKACREILERAEATVKTLVEGEGGELTEEHRPDDR